MGQRALTVVLLVGKVLDRSGWTISTVQLMLLILADVPGGRGVRITVVIEKMPALPVWTVSNILESFQWTIPIISKL